VILFTAQAGAATVWSEGLLEANLDFKNRAIAPLQVCFHDTSRQRKRIPLLNDFFGFSVGSLGEKVGGWAGGAGASLIPVYADLLQHF
jgi:hypothetical protein